MIPTRLRKKDLTSRGIFSVPQVLYFDIASKDPRVFEHVSRIKAQCFKNNHSIETYFSSKVTVLVTDGKLKKKNFTNSLESSTSPKPILDSHPSPTTPSDTNKTHKPTCESLETKNDYGRKLSKRHLRILTAVSKPSSLMSASEESNHADVDCLVSNDVIAKAIHFGIKICSLKDVVRLFSSDGPNIPMEEILKKDCLVKCESSGVQYRRLKGPFIKLEDLSGTFRPAILEFSPEDSFPRLLPTRCLYDHPSRPFIYQKWLKKIEEKASEILHQDLSTTQSLSFSRSPSHHCLPDPSVSRIVDRTKASLHRDKYRSIQESVHKLTSSKMQAFKNSKPGFCEICSIRYQDLEKHALLKSHIESLSLLCQESNLNSHFEEMDFTLQEESLFESKNGTSTHQPLRIQEHVLFSPSLQEKTLHPTDYFGRTHFQEASGPFTNCTSGILLDERVSPRYNNASIEVSSDDEPLRASTAPADVENPKCEFSCSSADETNPADPDFFANIAADIVQYAEIAIFADTELVQNSQNSFSIHDVPSFFIPSHDIAEPESYSLDICRDKYEPLAWSNSKDFFFNSDSQGGKGKKPLETINYDEIYASIQSMIDQVVEFLAEIPETSSREVFPAAVENLLNSFSSENLELKSAADWKELTDNISDDSLCPEIFPPQEESPHLPLCNSLSNPTPAFCSSEKENLLLITDCNQHSKHHESTAVDPFEYQSPVKYQHGIHKRTLYSSNETITVKRRRM